MLKQSDRASEKKLKKFFNRIHFSYYHQHSELGIINTHSYSKYMVLPLLLLKCTQSTWYFLFCYSRILKVHGTSSSVTHVYSKYIVLPLLLLTCTQSTWYFLFCYSRILKVHGTSSSVTQVYSKYMVLPLLLLTCTQSTWYFLFCYSSVFKILTTLCTLKNITN